MLQCAEGLYCHQRTSNQAVPYCTGGEAEKSTADFCAWDGESPKPEPTPPIPDDYFRLKLYWYVLLWCIEKLLGLSK